MELTPVRYPHLKRGRYSRLQSSDLSHFSRLLGSDRLLTDDLDGYNTDWMRSVRGGRAGAAVLGCSCFTAQLNNSLLDKLVIAQVLQFLGA